MGDPHRHSTSQPSSYYAVLGVRPDSSPGEIRTAYRRLALKWHPDRWLRQPWQVSEANQRFQHIQEAYQVLSDQRKRSLYDARIYGEKKEEEVEGFSEFVQEMVTLMANVRREEREYSLDELQRMLGEMARSFESPPPAPDSWWFEAKEGSRGSKRQRGEGDPTVRTKLRVQMFGSRSCR